MNAFVEKCNKIFGETTLHYHKFDNIDAVPENPYEAGTIDDVLFRKNWIDAVQWHMEDIIRDPQIDPVEALALKRRGEAQGEKSGRAAEKIEMAKALKSKGVDIDIIAETSGLSKAKIKML